VPERIADHSQVLFTLACFGVGGSLLAWIGIWLEMRPCPRARSVFSGGLCLLILALAALLWATGKPPEVIWQLLALGVACLAACGLQAAGVRRWANRILEPWVIWLVLLVGGPSFAALYAHQLNKFEDTSSFLCELLSVHGKEAAASRAVTDLGREIELFHYCALPKLRAAEEIVLAEKRFILEVIRVAGPSTTSNCHGWVFTGGAFGVPSEEVDAILADNGYLPVDEVQPGDLMICRNEMGLPSHTGIVRFAGEDGMVLVESKWGPLGVFLHAPETQPYGENFDFWRSPRLGHVLAILPQTAAETPEGVAVLVDRTASSGPTSSLSSP
jgi:hypothetical protein